MPASEPAVRLWADRTAFSPVLHSDDWVSVDRIPLVYAAVRTLRGGVPTDLCIAVVTEMEDRMRPVLRVGLTVLTAIGFLLPMAAAAQGDDFTLGHEPSAIVGQPDLTAIDPGLTAQSFDGPDAVAVDTVRRKMYVADYRNNRVLRFDLDEAYDSNPTAEAVFGQPDMTSNDEVSPPTAASLSSPRGLVVDDEGNLYVSDSGNGRILRYDDAATASSGANASLVLGVSDFTTSGTGNTQTTASNPQGLALGPDGELWAADGRRILRWDNASTLTNGAAADGVLGQADFTADLSDGPTATLMSNTLRGLVIDGNGTLFAADTVAHRIVRWDDAINKANGAAADGVLGQPDFTSSSSGVSATAFNGVRFLVIDSTGRLYASDAKNNRVLWFENAATLADGAPADGVLGAGDFDTKPESGAVNQITEAKGLALDGDGRLWVVAEDRNSVLLFAKPSDEEDDGGDNGGGGETAAPAQCAQLPDIALSPERIELAAGGRTTITITMRNLCADAPFSQADLLLSLSDGLSVADLPAGWLDLGQRAALQGLSLGLGETRSWTLTVAAADALPTAPLHVLELYYRGAAATRIDGVFVPAVPEVPATAEVPAVVEVPAAPVVETPQLPTVLPNTAGPLLPLGALVLSGLALAALGVIGRRRG
jgi:sugar lactone lactonase YvrE